MCGVTRRAGSQSAVMHKAGGSSLGSRGVPQHPEERLFCFVLLLRLRAQWSGHRIYLCRIDS